MIAWLLGMGSKVAQNAAHDPLLPGGLHMPSRQQLPPSS